MKKNENTVNFLWDRDGNGLRFHIANFYPCYHALRDLVPFVQFKKREKRPGRFVDKGVWFYIGL